MGWGGERTKGKIRVLRWRQFNKTTKAILILIYIIIIMMQYKRYRIWFFLTIWCLCSQSLNNNHGTHRFPGAHKFSGIHQTHELQQPCQTHGTKKAKFMEPKRSNSRKRLNSRKRPYSCPPKKTPINKLRMASMVWKISIGQLGVTVWLCSLPAPALLIVSWI